MGCMSVQPDRFELARRALANARRIAERLGRQQDDLARKMPGETQGGEALRDAAAAVQRVAHLIENSGAAPSHRDP